MVLNPLLEYRKIDQYASQRIQYVTVAVAEMIITVLYISPRTKKDEETKVLTRVKQFNGGKAVIMGDLNARYGK